MKLSHLRNVADGDSPVVICEGHVDRAEFADRVDTDDAAELLGDLYKSKGSYPTKADVRSIAGMVRHSWGSWSGEGKRRRWDECHKDEPGAQAFTVLDQEGNP